VAQIEREAGEASTEFFMGIAGPIASMLIGVLCLALAWLVGWPLGTVPATPIIAMLMWLGYINLALGIFNLVPGFPLDGGRVLRGIIWWVTGDGLRATRIAARIGQIVAFAFIIIGILRFFGGAGIGGLWTAFIGWFLLDAAGASRAQIETSAVLRNVRAADVLERDCLVVDGHENLETFVNEYLLRTGKNCFLVQNGQGIRGNHYGLRSPQNRPRSLALYDGGTGDAAFGPTPRSRTRHSGQRSNRDHAPGGSERIAGGA
jgi:hypothetical protein